MLLKLVVRGSFFFRFFLLSDVENTLCMDLPMFLLTCLNVFLWDFHLQELKFFLRLGSDTYEWLVRCCLRMFSEACGITIFYPRTDCCKAVMKLFLVLDGCFSPATFLFLEVLFQQPR